MKEVYEFIKQCGIYYLATSENNRPMIRPFGTIDLFEDKLYFFTDKTKKVSMQIKANPQIQICGMAGDKWIRLEAAAVEDDRVEARQHMLDAVPILKDAYAADDGKSQVFYLKDGAATISAFAHTVKVIKF